MCTTNWTSVFSKAPQKRKITKTSQTTIVKPALTQDSNESQTSQGAAQFLRISKNNPIKFISLFMVWGFLFGSRDLLPLSQQERIFPVKNYIASTLHFHLLRLSAHHWGFLINQRWGSKAPLWLVNLNSQNSWANNGFYLFLIFIKNDLKNRNYMVIKWEGVRKNKMAFFCHWDASMFQT